MKALLTGFLLGASICYSAPLLMAADELTATATNTPAFATTATLPCGNIIGPTSPNSSTIETVAITDCADPFGVTTDPASPYTLYVAGEAVTDGVTIIVPDGQTDDISFTGTSHQNGVHVFPYVHDGDDYRYQSLYPPYPEAADYSALAYEYFSDASSQVLYAEIAIVDFNWEDTNNYFYTEDGEFIVDAVTGEFVEDRYYDFYNWA